jgi:precorrin-6A/cobalt-precorrin-6A reductase
MRILVLGGTTEASALARALAEAGVDAIFSYAGRTGTPAAQPLPVRTGGFGGIPGLVRYLRDKSVTHLVDATHPFAAQMSTHAVAASNETGVPLVALERAPWDPAPGDNWTRVSDTEAAVATLPDRPTRIFLAIGRQTLAPFAAAPQHHYLLRFVDPPESPPPLPQAELVVDRGPFTPEADLALLTKHGIEFVVSKNAGGSGARAKLDAARLLGLPVTMIDRPPVPERRRLESVDAVMEWLSHSTDRGL